MSRFCLYHRIWLFSFEPHCHAIQWTRHMTRKTETLCGTNKSLFSWSKTSWSRDSPSSWAQGWPKAKLDKLFFKCTHNNMFGPSITEQVGWCSRLQIIFLPLLSYGKLQHIIISTLLIVNVQVLEQSLYSSLAEKSEQTSIPISGCSYIGTNEPRINFKSQRTTVQWGLDLRT